MSAETIDHHTLARLVEAGAVRAAHVVGQKGGWGVILKYGMAERALAASRSRQVRIFKRLETVVAYLKGVGIVRFDVDAADFDPAQVKTYSRPDRAEALKRAHGAAAHDLWFREEVRRGLAEADDPKTKWIPDEDVKRQSAERRAEWAKRAAVRAEGGAA